MATDLQIVTGAIEIVDVTRPTAVPQIIEQTAAIVEVVTAGPQGRAGKDADADLPDLVLLFENGLV